MPREQEPVEANLTDVFANSDDQGSHIGRRLIKMINDAQIVEDPPFPRQIQVETSNICNHACTFCAYTQMQRPKRHMDRGLFRRVVSEAYECGAREIGLFAGAEPLACKWIGEYITHCRDIGYEYIYISTNGALADEGKFKEILDAGIHSIKFSVNGGTRAVYKDVHGRDDFDRVIANIKYVNSYRAMVPQKVFLAVSFVGMPHTDHSFSNLKELLSTDVDEIIYYEASNQSGQMPELPDPPYRDCHLPFNKAHISREGYLKACCNDYDNLLAIENLNTMSMLEAWHSEKFRALRRRHMSDTLEGTVCANCIRASKVKPAPINPSLVEHGVLWEKQL